MKFRVKAFGILVAGALALGALLVQSASAIPLTVNEGGVGKTYYTGDQDGGKFTFTSTATVQCTTVVLTATTEGASVSEVTIFPSTLSGCTAFGFATAHIKTNGCSITVTTGSATQLSATEVTLHPQDVHVECPTGKKIDVTPTTFGVSVCTQSIGSQTPTGGHGTATNSGAATADGMDVTLQLTLKGLEWTGTGGACGTSGTNAELTGNSTVRAFSNEAHTTQRGITFI